MQIVSLKQSWLGRMVGFRMRIEVARRSEKVPINTRFLQRGHWEAWLLCTIGKRGVKLRSWAVCLIAIEMLRLYRMLMFKWNHNIKITNVHSCSKKASFGNSLYQRPFYTSIAVCMTHTFPEICLIDWKIMHFIKLNTLKFFFNVCLDTLG